LFEYVEDVLFAVSGNVANEEFHASNDEDNVSGFVFFDVIPDCVAVAIPKCRGRIPDYLVHLMSVGDTVVIHSGAQTFEHGIADKEEVLFGGVGNIVGSKGANEGFIKGEIVSYGLRLGFEGEEFMG